MTGVQTCALPIFSWAQRKRLAATRDPNERYVAIADRICEQGWFGQKTGRGWYVYQEGKPSPNADVEKIILDEAAKKGVQRRALSADEIQSRIVMAMINEGARILEEGIAARAVDIDMVYLTGYGFPAYLGGPMFHADIVGLANVVAAMEKFARGYRGDSWQIAPLLASLAREGKTFNKD